MKHGWILGFYCLGMVACQNNKLNVPQGILQPDSLSEIQAEFYVIEAANNLAIINHDSTQASYDEYYKAILKKHHTRKAQIDSSMMYYSAYPEVLDSIFSKTMLILDKKELEQRKKQE